MTTPRPSSSQTLDVTNRKSTLEKQTGDGKSTDEASSSNTNVEGRGRAEKGPVSAARKMTDEELVDTAQRLGYHVMTIRGPEQRSRWEQKVSRLLDSRGLLQEVPREDAAQDDEMLIDVVTEFFNPDLAWDIDGIRFEMFEMLFPQNYRGRREVRDLFDRMVAVRAEAMAQVRHRVQERYIGMEYERRVGALDPAGAVAVLDTHIATLEGELEAEESRYENLAATAEKLIVTAEKHALWRLEDDALDTQGLVDLEARARSTANA